MCARLASCPVARSSKTRTRWPAAVSPSTRCEPMNPAPPVTRNRSFMASRAKPQAATRGSLGEQRLDVGVGVERLQVVELLADADVLHRQAELLLDAEDRPAL